MMPATSLKQKKFMDAAAHNPSFAKQAGIPQSVAKDFSSASKGMKFSGGPKSRADSQTINNPKTNQGKQELFKKGGNTMANTSRMNKLEELGRVDSEKAYTSKGKKNLAAEKKRIVGGLKKMANGGITSAKMGSVKTAAPSRDGVASKGKTQGTMVKMSGSKPLGMKRGGKC
jgi:hypothetical protein